jgi:hypothetical protein
MLIKLYCVLEPNLPILYEKPPARLNIHSNKYRLSIHINLPSQLKYRQLTAYFNNISAGCTIDWTLKSFLFPAIVSE